MKLSVRERLVLLGVLPSEADFVTLLLVKSLRSVLDISPEEAARVNLKVDGNRLTWDEKGEEEVDFDLTEAQEAVIRKALTDLDVKKKLTLDHVSVYQKFVSPTPALKIAKD